jgi:hypothetical protein
MTTTKLYQYRNGNYDVTIMKDGTKIRDYDEFPLPVVPESIDLKITNYCDAGCAFCHEMSTKEGKHCEIDRTISLMHTFAPHNAEIAIGGGNPLSHPDLNYFLHAVRSMDLIANITVNQLHIKKFEHEIKFYQEQNLIKGLGISWFPHRIEDLDTFMGENVVIHIIMGVHPISDIERLLERFKKVKILVLGYKTFGRGEHYYDKLNEVVEKNKYDWFTNIGRLMHKEGLTLSFDNLAIEQLKMKRFFIKENWDKFYMGDDGHFTMYIDAVKEEYARSSTSKKRYKYKDTIPQMFNHIRSLYVK